jgi:hypothetical protein
VLDQARGSCEANARMQGLGMVGVGAGVVRRGGAVMWG